MDVVELGERAVVVGGNVGDELLLGLFAEIPGVDQEQDPLCVRVLEQAIDRGDGGVGLAGAGRHLDERARVRVLERRFKAFDGMKLAVSQPGLGKSRQPPEPCA